MRRPKRPGARLRPPADTDIVDGSLRELSTGQNRTVWPSREPPAPPGIFPVDSCNENLPEKIIHPKYAGWPVRRAHSPASLVVPAKVGTHEQPPVFPALALRAGPGRRGCVGSKERTTVRCRKRAPDRYACFRPVLYREPGTITLTKQRATCRGVSAPAPAGAGAGEITPAMIEAGELELFRCLGASKPSGEDYRATAEAVYRAMKALAPTSSQARDE
jgi:hypothetical protein